MKKPSDDDVLPDLPPIDGTSEDQSSENEADDWGVEDFSRPPPRDRLGAAEPMDKDDRRGELSELDVGELLDEAECTRTRADSEPVDPSLYKIDMEDERDFAGSDSQWCDENHEIDIAESIDLGDDEVDATGGDDTKV